MTKIDTKIYRFPLLESVYKDAKPRLARDLVIMRENFLIPYYRYLDTLTRHHIFEGKPVEDVNALFAAIKKEIDGGTGIHSKANLSFLGKIVEKLMPQAMADKFFKGLPDPATSQPVQDYDAQAQKALSAMPPKVKADAQQLVAVGKKNAKLQGYIIGALTVGTQVLAKFGGTYGASMGIPPQLTGAVVGAIGGGLIAGIAAKMYGKSWGEAFKQGIKGALAGGAAGALGGLLGGSGGTTPPAADPAAFDQADNFTPDEPAGAAPGGKPPSTAGSGIPQIAGGSGGTPELGPPSATTPDPALQGATPTPDAAAADQADNFTPNEPAGAAPQMTAPQVMQADWFSQLSPEAQKWMGGADKSDPFILQRLIQAIPSAASVIPPELISQDAMNAARGAISAAGGPNVEESREINVNRLVEQGIVDGNATILTYRIAEAVGRARPRSVQLTNEGIGDMFKKAGAWLKTKAQNATQTVTIDKLNNAWQKAGSPSDSDQIATVLKSAEVPDTVIAKVYADMGLPAPGGAAQGGAQQGQGGQGGQGGAQQGQGGAQQGQGGQGGASPWGPGRKEQIIGPNTDEWKNGPPWLNNKGGAAQGASGDASADQGGAQQAQGGQGGGNAFGQMAGQLSTQPDELDQVKKNAGIGGAGAFGQMAGQLAAQPTASSTGGTTTGVSGVGSGVVKHTANPNNPNQPKAAPSQGSAGDFDSQLGVPLTAAGAQKFLQIPADQRQAQMAKAKAAGYTYDNKTGFFTPPAGDSAQPKAAAPADSGSAAMRSMMNLVSPQAPTPAAAPTAAPVPPGRKQGGGKVAGQLSQTPGAQRKRDARAAQKQAGIDADRERLLPDYGSVKENNQIKFRSKFLGIDI